MASSIPALASPAAASEPRSRRRIAAGAAVGLGLIAVVVLIALLAPWIAPYDPSHQDLFARLKPPGWAPPEGGPTYWLGTDQLGRDILSRIMFGARVSLLIGLGAVTASAALGTVLGLIAGFARGVAEQVIMRTVDLLFGIPFILLALAVTGALGPGLGNLILVLIVTRWVQYARVLFGQVLAASEREYVEAAHALGLPGWRIIFRHILPNVAPTTVVLATMDLGFVIILESGLSFLGLGVPPATPTWGAMLADGRSYLSNAWWLGTFPGFAIMWTVLGFNLLGDWLRDKMDPTLRA